MSKLFSHAGVSKLDGEFKVRYANDALRTKVLIKNGHTEIELLDLGDEFTKAEICQVLMQHEAFQDEAAQTAITDFVVRNCKSMAAPVVEAEETEEVTAS